jgi:hypothetical protein
MFYKKRTNTLVLVAIGASTQPPPCYVVCVYVDWCVCVFRGGGCHALLGGEVGVDAQTVCLFKDISDTCA